MKTYQAIAPQIVGTPSEWGYSFTFCDYGGDSVIEARDAGMDQFEHDDFIIAEFNDEHKCVAIHIEGKGRFTKSSEDYGDYVKGINNELGLDE